MNKTALKNFATWSRRKLIEQVQTKAFLYGIDEKNGLLMEEQFGQLVINGQTYPLSMKSSFTALQKQLEQKGYKQLLEEVAYTWFNRIIAIRYMEVHEYLPEKVNVLSSSVGRVDPDILFEFDTMDLAIDEAKVRELVNAGDTEAAFRLLFVAQCNALNPILPFMFEQIQDYTELLLPEFLLDAESVIKTLIFSDELTESFSEIEVIGWLYQFYNTELKENVLESSESSKIEKLQIPAATQLFTPKWIVKYMVENTVGHLYKQLNIIDYSHLNYLIEPEDDGSEVIIQLDNITDIKIIDPCVGSGHILSYAFDILYDIYEKLGYERSLIPKYILENNLVGLDIDYRAVQLANFTLLMKARQKNRRVFREKINFKIFEIPDFINNEEILDKTDFLDKQTKKELKSIFVQFSFAKNIGSLMKIPTLDFDSIFLEIEQNVGNQISMDTLPLAQNLEKIKEIFNICKLLSDKYHIVITNPPYMGSKRMNEELKKYVNKFYPNTKSDLSAAFLEKTSELTENNGLYSMINQQSWMFLSSYFEYRKELIDKSIIISMLHLGIGTFKELNSKVIQSTAFVMQKKYDPNFKGKYYKLNETYDGKQKEKLFLSNENVYMSSLNDFEYIPGKVISYWADEKTKEIYRNAKIIDDYYSPRQGIATGKNEDFVRFWFEVPIEKIGLQFKNVESALDSGLKWFPYNKGGKFKKWYGNQEYVISFNQESYVKLSNQGNHLPSKEFYFKKGISWSKVTNIGLSARAFNEGFLFDVAGCTIFGEKLEYVMAFLNSNVAEHLIRSLGDSMNYEVGTIKSLPILFDNEKESEILKIVNEIVSIVKSDYDSQETSWNFKKNPLLKYKQVNISDAYSHFLMEHSENENKILELEKKINDIFIELYGFEGIVSNQVKANDLKLSLKDKNSVAIKFLSYFIGCCFGRYQVFNNFDTNKIIAFTESHYFDKDIVSVLRDFLSIAFSQKSVEENLQWLAKALEIKDGEDYENRLRRYFVEEFYKNHCKMYQNHPVYWLVDSGKQKSLRTLIYMHQYQPDTMATIRFEHLQEIQAKYQQEISDLENRLINPNLSATDKKKLNAEKVSFEKKIDELREFDKRLAAIAAEEIEIDLDDGVKVNYEKFYRGGKGVLAKIK